MMPLHEQYRPSAWTDVVGQDNAVQTIRTVARRGIGGRVWWIAGASGTGKTTIARILASELADESCVVEIDGADLSLSMIRDIERQMHYYGLGPKPGRVWIVNEAHRLKDSIVSRLLTLCEPIPAHVAIIFTTTTDGQELLFDGALDAKPLLSRCIEVYLARRDLAKPFARRAREIADKEGLNGRSDEDYVKLARRCANNLRAMLQAIEAGAMLA